jgi:TorA maturation chaperone TorD
MRQDPGVAVVAEEDLLRAHVYRLLASTLSHPPTATSFQSWGALSGDDSDFGTAVSNFADSVRSTDIAVATQNFQDLFIGLGRGEFVPYGSYYLTGFLNEKPLARLRQDMDRLLVKRVEAVSDPEDHIAAVLDMMAGLIDGAFGAPLTPQQQKAFFNAHLGSWAPVFFRDLEASTTSRLYAALGTVGREFMLIEDRAFAMV